MIREGMTLSLGGGNSVAALAAAIAESGLKVTVITPSSDTKLLCEDLGLTVRNLSCEEPVSLAFDGCDELDLELNALKSCGAIHTREKIAAELADEYILFASEGKLHENLPYKHPITLEVLPSALALVQKRIAEMGGKAELRKSENKAGTVISDDGNLILDAWFNPEILPEPSVLAAKLDAIPGLIGHAIFAGTAAKAIVEMEDGSVRILERSRNKPEAAHFAGMKIHRIEPEKLI